MSDEADQAREYEERFTEAAIRRARGEQLRQDDAPLNCIGCGDRIEYERRQANPKARRCVVCQSAVERRDRLFARRPS